MGRHSAVPASDADLEVYGRGAKCDFALRCACRSLGAGLGLQDLQFKSTEG